MSIAYRPPSHTWEPAVVPDLPHCAVWVWFRPPTSPLDVVFRIPEEILQRLGPYLTPRRLLMSVGGGPPDVESWVIGGTGFATGGGDGSAFDQPLPLSVTTPDPTIVFRLRAGVSPPMYPAAFPPAMPVAAAPSPAFGPGPGSERQFAAIESDWQAILLLDAQLASVRKQLGAQQGRLQSLNRDLSAEERVAADNLDKKDWMDARRWLRDAASQVSRYIRDHDIGTTSAAGRRTMLEQSYNEVVVPRKGSPNLAALQNEFEVYRKTAQTLLIAMQNTTASAARDGEQRAQQILTRIAAKIRNAKKR